jgi:hypothetical protein
VKPENVNPLRAVQVAVHAEETIENNHVAVDQGIGPMFLYSDHGWFVGLESVTRLRWKAGRFQPYLVMVNGAAYSEHWTGSDVPYTLTTAAGVGVLSRISDKSYLTLEAKWYHHSNGRSFFGDETRRVFGARKASKNEGYQNISVSVGLVWRF